MKITKYFPLLLVIILAMAFVGCSHMDKTDVEETIISELDLLKNLDSDTAQKYISYQELFPDAQTGKTLSSELEEVFSLFFQDFDYKILDIDVDKKHKTAEASVRLSTIDAHTLARDFAEAKLKKEILYAADTEEEDLRDTSLSLEDRYLLLNQLLKTNTYELTETNSVIQLQNTGDSNKESWEIKRTHALENDLVGGLVTYLSDPDILSPEETLGVHLKTLKKMNVEEMSNYLGVESIFNSSDEMKNAIASALVEQVHKIFNYKVKESSVDGYHASIQTDITTFDSDAILSAYQKELSAYLDSPDAVIDGFQKRYDKSYELLLSNIQNNSATKKEPATFVLTNDGISWKLENNQNELGNAIFGTLATNIVPEEDAVN